MSAYTEAEIEARGITRAASDPVLAKYIQAGDPRVLMQIRAQAAMLAMLSEQIDVAQFEPYVKARDSTVLADATLKGILPLARSCRATLSVTNGDASPFTVAAGRRMLDPKGRVFMVDSDVTIGAGLTASVPVTQQTTRTVTHTATSADPYYRIEVPITEEDLFLTNITVWMGDSEFAYKPDWFNVQPGELAYQAETDERRRLFVCMGAQDVIGYGVQIGDQFELRIVECEGKVDDLTPGAPFSLEYAYTTADGLLKLQLAAVADQGAAPPTAAELRITARYAAIYDHNAVYLGEFGLLLRRYLTGVEFLSVWNEQIEEQFRGPSLDNINTLFIAGRVAGMDDATFRQRATDLIMRADDSYKLEFVDVLDWPTTVTITAKVAVVHDPDTVAAQIRGAVLAEYGAGSPEVSVGMSDPLRVRAIGDLIKAAVPALQDNLSDFQVTISTIGATMPEMFVQITDDSLTVDVERADYNAGLWNH